MIIDKHRMHIRKGVGRSKTYIRTTAFKTNIIIDSELRLDNEVKKSKHTVVCSKY